MEISGIKEMKWRMSIDEEHADGSLALEVSKPELKRPPLFKVVLINDDYTPNLLARYEVVLEEPTPDVERRAP